MLRLRFRVLAVCCLVLALSAPSADARPLAARAASAPAIARWLASVLERIERFLNAAPAQAYAAAGYAGPLTGSCIDPNGTNPCNR